MKALFLATAVTLAGMPEALADSPQSISLGRLATAGEAPVGTAKSEATCPDGGGTILAGTRVVGKARVTLIHGCGGSDEMGVMSIEVGGAHFDADPRTISYYAGNMTDAPEELTLVSDRIVPGTLADGTAAVVQATTTHSKFVFRRIGKVQSEYYELRVQVCSLDDAPACANVETVRCAKGGCPAPTLSRGTLRIVDRERKAHVFRIARDPAPAPPP